MRVRVCVFGSDYGGFSAISFSSSIISNSGKFEFSGVSKVSQVIEALQEVCPRSDFNLKYFNEKLDRALSLDNLVDSEDEVLELTALRKTGDGDEGEDEPRGRSTLKNESHCRIVLQYKGSETPVFLEPGDVPFEFEKGLFTSVVAFMVFK